MKLKGKVVGESEIEFELSDVIGTCLSDDILYIIGDVPIVYSSIRAAELIKKFPCPSCTWRGPVWLDDNYHCVYCDYTYQPGSDNYAWIWRVVPLEWWIEEQMIEADEIPTLARMTDGKSKALASRSHQRQLTHKSPG